MKASIVISMLLSLMACANLNPSTKNEIAGPFTAWASYNQSYDSQRFSELTGINAQNISSLQKVCELPIEDNGPFQSGLLMIDGILFVTTAHTTVAINSTNCALLWQHRYSPEEKELYPVNRGLAYSEGVLFRATGDARLLALNSRNGKELWRKKIGEPQAREWYSAAPIVWKNLIFIGVAGGDIGARGRIAAFETSTGQQVWNFNTVVSDSQAGATTWTSYSLDPETGELFVPTGSPNPDFQPESKGAVSPLSSSLLVLDALTGKLKWSYQIPSLNKLFYDVTSAPVLYKTSAGESRIALGSKDGYLYSIRREQHDLKFKTAVTSLKDSTRIPTAEAFKVCPGGQGGILWNGPSFNSQLKQLVVGSVDWCAMVKLEPVPGKTVSKKKYLQDPPEQARGWVVAMDSDSGKVLWKFASEAPIVSGILTTRNNLVFAGDLNGNLIVFEATNGSVLLKKNLGGPLAGGLITYSVGASQYLAATTGNESQKTFVTKGRPVVVIMKAN